MDDVTFHQQVIDHELGRIFLIGYDAAGFPCSQEHILRRSSGKEGVYLRAIGQVGLLSQASEDVPISLMI